MWHGRTHPTPGQGAACGRRRMAGPRGERVTDQTIEGLVPVTAHPAPLLDAHDRATLDRVRRASTASSSSARRSGHRRTRNSVPYCADGPAAPKPVPQFELISPRYAFPSFWCSAKGSNLRPNHARTRTRRRGVGSADSSGQQGRRVRRTSSPPWSSSTTGWPRVRPARATRRSQSCTPPSGA